MLNENLKRFRKQKGFSQQELAEQLHVVRQTISKWEQGLSVPDADLLIRLSDVLEVPVSDLLNVSQDTTKSIDLQDLARNLEEINFQLAQRKEFRRKVILWCLVILMLLIAILFAVLCLSESPYLNWDYADPEKAIAGVAIHSFEWLFIRLAPIVFIACAIGFIALFKRNQ